MAETAYTTADNDSYLTHDRGVLSWLFSLDHKRIGVMYLVSILTAFLLGGTFSTLVRMELMYLNKPAESVVAAKDVAFPRLNLFSLGRWCNRCVFFLLTLLFGGQETGWIFYPPYSTSTE